MNAQMAITLDENMRKVIDAFRTHGYATTGYLVDETGLSRPTVSKRLDQLKAAEHIEYIHKPTAFWQLRDDPEGYSE